MMLLNTILLQYLTVSYFSSNIIFQVLLCTVPYSVAEKIFIDDISLIPTFLSDDIIEIYHLRSALLPIVKTAVGAFHIQSSGIALRSTLTSNTVVLQFEPLNISACYLPIIVIDADQNIRFTIYFYYIFLKFFVFKTSYFT